MHPAESYTVRPFVPADAPGVAALVQRVYGGLYYHDELYHPDEVIRLNATGHLFSVVALDPAGTVVGHTAIMREELGCVAETGEAMVDPAHRAHHLLHEMREVLYQHAPRLGIVALTSTAVTNHVLSQKTYESFAAHPCGLQLGFAPRQLTMPPSVKDRLSVANYVKLLIAPPAVVVHAPAWHWPLIKRIYAQFAIPVEFRPAAPLSGAGKLVTHFLSALQYGIIEVRRAGTTLPDQIRRCRRALCDGMGAAVVLLELPLDQAATPELCRVAEDDGFFFSGIGMMASPHGDVLRLQYLNEQLDPLLLQLENPFAREMLEYIVKERQRVSQS